MKATVIIPYFNSPEMFRLHQKVWLSWPVEMLKAVEFVVVDDCSDKFPIDGALPESDCPLQLRCFRITKKVAWNWRAARNIGAHEAEDSWLLMTDMDHVVPFQTMGYLLKRLDENKFDRKRFYTFDRIRHKDNIEYKAHPNSYWLHKDLYWYAGGYDEEVSGVYGLDGAFRRDLEHRSRGYEHLHGVPLMLYSRSEIDDCSVKSEEMKRKEGRDLKELQDARNVLYQKMLRGERPTTMTFPFERVR